MTLSEALQFFDGKQHTTDEEMANVKCCGIPVTQNSVDGIRHIRCHSCKRAVMFSVGYGWMMENYGNK